MVTSPNKKKSCLYVGFPRPQRMDLGECSKIHDLALRADYEIASKERDLFFELDVSHVFVKCDWIGPMFVCLSVFPVAEF